MTFAEWIWDFLVDRLDFLIHSPHVQIDPTKITNFARTDSELQAFILFTGLIAGKNSDIAARVLSNLLNKRKDQTPFTYLSELGEIGIQNALVASKSGQYTRLTKFILGVMQLDLRQCSFEELMNVHGLGLKSASFFLLHSREGWKGCVLDTHILSWLRNHGVEDTPKSTPQNLKKYQELSKQWLFLSSIHYPHLSPADRDLFVWMEQSGRLDNDNVFADSLSPIEVEG